MTTCFNVSPNPTKGEAMVNFSLSITSHVKISVLDLSGKVLQQICNKMLKADEYTFPVSIKDFSKGMYLLKMESDFGSKSTLLNLSMCN